MEHGRRLLVDGMNVIGSRPDGWWRDRPAAMRTLAEALARFAEAAGVEVTVVFDGRPRAIEAGGVDVRFAPQGGPNAADDVIVELVSSDPRVTVVTSDSRLERRVRALGADVTGAGDFRGRLEALRSPGPGPD